MSSSRCDFLLATLCLEIDTCGPTISIGMSSDNNMQLVVRVYYRVFMFSSRCLYMSLGHLLHAGEAHAAESAARCGVDERICEAFLPSS